MRVLTLLGTRPEIIRLSRVIPRLDQELGRENHYLVNTGQNPDPALSSRFFAELGLREPDVNLLASGSFGQQIGVAFPAMEHILQTVSPDRLLVLGDTNSALGAIVAARMGVPVYHMEAGNRSYALASPEEVNRRLVDHVSTVLLPYTERSRQNLLSEGIRSSRIFVTGNPIWEVIQHYRKQDMESGVLAELGLKPRQYFLVTLHRAENVDDQDRLYRFLSALELLWKEYSIPVIVSTHPRTRVKVRAYVLDNYTRRAISLILFLEPFGFFDFITLESNARCVLSDSGTVQEECSLLRTPMVCLRDYTERPECLEAGASVLTGSDQAAILSAVRLVIEYPVVWSPPPDYLRTDVAETVVRILLGYLPKGTL
jgi:UDP-N-acetylglucosamine 2-epimerase (non-hydrolysing)